MCAGLDGLQQSITGWAKGFDARTLTPAEAAAVVSACARMEASISSVKALAAARSAEGSGWKHEGYRSAAEQLAHRTGMSPSSARRALEAGRRMADQPEVAGAALAGDLFLEQAAAVSDGVAADPTKARELIDKAKRLSMPELNDVVARTKAANTDLEAQRRARHAKRSLIRYTDRDGALHGRLYGHPEDGATIWRMLDPIRRRLNVLRKQQIAGGNYEVEPLEALDYDALKTLADLAVGQAAELSADEMLGLGLFPGLAAAAGRALGTTGAAGAQHSRSQAGPAGVLSDPEPSAGQGELLSLLETPPTPTVASPAPPALPGKARKLAGSPVKVIVRIDLPALVRGVPLEGELCDIGGCPVPVSTIERLIASGQTFLAAALTKHEQVLGVYHHGRRPNAHQRTALELTQPACSVEGCSARAVLQYDHRIAFADIKITAFDLIDRLCRFHHGKKTHERWALVPGTGKRAFVSPTDPRHPDRRGGSAPSTATTGTPRPRRGTDAPRRPATSSKSQVLALPGGATLHPPPGR